MTESSAVPDARDLARWSTALAGIARTGLGFTQNLYERERFEEVLHIAADIKAAASTLLRGAASTCLSPDCGRKRWPSMLTGPVGAEQVNERFRELVKKWVCHHASLR
jgi:hypothetical protein